jgi:hypothetical protein
MLRPSEGVPAHWMVRLRHGLGLGLTAGLVAVATVVQTRTAGPVQRV